MPPLSVAVCVGEGPFVVMSWDSMKSLFFEELILVISLNFCATLRRQGPRLCLGEKVLGPFCVYSRDGGAGRRPLSEDAWPDSQCARLLESGWLDLRFPITFSCARVGCQDYLYLIQRIQPAVRYRPKGHLDLCLKKSARIGFLWIVMFSCGKYRMTLRRS